MPEEEKITRKTTTTKQNKKTWEGQCREYIESSRMAQDKMEKYWSIWIRSKLIEEWVQQLNNMKKFQENWTYYVLHIYIRSVMSMLYIKRENQEEQTFQPHTGLNDLGQTIQRKLRRKASLCNYVQTDSTKKGLELTKWVEDSCIKDFLITTFS